MRCLNCNTLVGPNDSRCLRCGACCTTTVREQNASRGAYAATPALILGLICLGVSGYMGLQTYQVLNSYARITGHVAHIEVVRKTRSTAYYAHIAFLVNGQRYEAQTGGGASMHVGEPVTVYYNREDPSKNRADTTSALWGYPLAIGGVGLVLLFAGLVASSNAPRAARAPVRQGASAGPSLNEAFVVPGSRPLVTASMASSVAASARALGCDTVAEEPRQRQRPLLVRSVFGLVWAVCFFLVSAVVLSLIATSGAGGDPAVQKQFAEQAGARLGPWTLLGSILTASVLGFMGLLPGTARRAK